MTKDSLPNSLVSVVMPNLNKGGFIADAIESILSQTYEKFELLVIDNGSDDQSISLIENFIKKDTRISLTREPRRGVSYALNTGIGKAQGAFVTFLGSDDICHEERLSKQVKCLQEKNASVCYTEGWMIDDRGELINKLYNKDVAKLPTIHEGMIFHELIRRNFIIGGSVMVSRRCLDNDSYDASLTFGEDWDLWVRLSRRFHFHYVPEPLYGYRVYSGNTWAKGNEERIQANNVLMYEKWLRDFQDLNRDDRNFILKRLLQSRMELDGVVGMLQVALAHPSASILLLGRAKSSIAYRMKKMSA